MTVHRIPPATVNAAITDTGTRDPNVLSTPTNGAHKIHDRPQIPADNIRIFFFSSGTKSAVQAVNTDIPDEIVIFKAMHAIIANAV